MNLQILSFDGDKISDRRIKEESNYCDNSHIYAATFGIAQLILSEFSPIDLDGNQKLTIKANVEQQMTGNPGYNCDTYFNVSYFNLDGDTSRALYRFKKFDEDFQVYVSNLLLDILVQIDMENGGKNNLAQRREGIMEHLRGCGFQKKILLERFSKISRNKKYKAMVYQVLSQSIGEAVRVEIVELSSDKVITSEYMTEIPGTVLRAKTISRAFWDGDRFYVVLGKGIQQTTSYIEVPQE